MSERSTPLTDAMIQEIEQRLTWRGAKVAAARYAGISRQNLGKFFRERGVGRDSEILLSLDEFSRWPLAEQLKFAGKQASMDSPSDPEPPQPSEMAERKPDGEPDSLPAWLL